MLSVSHSKELLEIVFFSDVLLLLWAKAKTDFLVLRATKFWGHFSSAREWLKTRLRVELQRKRHFQELV